jgi:hypothetical protein
VNIRLWAEGASTMKVEVEFTCDLDPDHPDWPEVQWCQVLISEDELPSLTKADMRRLRITRAALREVFAEAKELTNDIKPRERIIADRAWRDDRRYGRSKDDFLVGRCRYSAASDPNLQAAKGSVQ